jgi:hypothetical protein
VGAALFLVFRTLAQAAAASTESRAELARVRAYDAYGELVKSSSLGTTISVHRRSCTVFASGRVDVGDRATVRTADIRSEETLSRKSIYRVDS